MSDLLRIEDLSVVFDTDDGTVQAVDRVSFGIRRGEVLGLVGESGCGKSVTSMSCLRLVPQPPGRITNGHVWYDDQDLLTLPIEQLRKIRGRDISMIFQEPMTALSPLHRIGKQMMEALQVHLDISKQEAWKQSEEWLQKVGIPDPGERLYSYPHQLSGGMRQRVMIAMALMLQPKLIIADEPTTALDVTIQAQVFDLMMEMKAEETSLLLITHDMGVVWELCDRVVVMYASQIVEQGPKEQVFATPRHPYTEGLLAAVPRLTGERQRLKSIEGQVPSPLDYPSGCRFRERCPYAFDRCEQEDPELYKLEGNRDARCFLRDPENPKPDMEEQDAY